MRLVGLTGSIGCGKSTVCSLIEEGDVINLDEIAHELLRAGTGATKLVAARFPDCVASDGSIDRQLLGPKIFSSASDRKWLNSVMHWRIALSLLKRVLWLWLVRGSSVVCLDAPLLFETGLNRICFAGTICVKVDPEVQIQRLTLRDKISAELAQQKIDAQMSQAEKVKQTMERVKSRWGISRWLVLIILPLLVFKKLIA